MDIVNDYYDNKFEIPTKKYRVIGNLIPEIASERLTEKQLRVFTMYHVLKMNQQNIAETLKLSQPTVSRHLRSADDIVNGYLDYALRALYFMEAISD